MGEGNRTRAESIPAIERATGRSWKSWVAHFEGHGATSLGHAEIARIARAEMPEELEKPDWWAQATAIAFEQHAGLRVPGQSSTGDFRVGANRTVSLDRDAAVEAWAAGPGAASEHLGRAASGHRRSRTDKRSFFRFELEDAGRVEVSATPHAKDPAKTLLSVSHAGLAEPDGIEAWRAHWKGLLAAL